MRLPVSGSRDVSETHVLQVVLIIVCQSPLNAHSPRVVCQSFVTVPEHKMLHLTGVTHCQVLGCAVFSLSSACTSVCLDRST